MSRKQRGFTLIELMIVIAIIAIIAAIAIPNLLAARLAANETAAIATLRNIVSSQAQFQQSGAADTDGVGGNGDGTGAYGAFVEMAGGISARVNPGIVPPVLSTGFRNVDPVTGTVTRSGYVFKLFLADPANAPQCPDIPGELAAVTGVGNEDLAETTWCAYAWPVNYNQSGNRTFFTNQAGDVLATDAGDPAVAANGYEGIVAMPDGDAVYTVGGDITGPTSINGVPAAAVDGNLWRQVN